MSVLIIKIRQLYRIFYCLKSHLLEICCLISILISMLVPLLFPTGRGYKYLTLREINDDLQMCLVTRRPPDFKLCPLVSRNLDNFKHVNKKLDLNFLEEMPIIFKILPGGRWFPKNCSSWQRVAIIVPYRNREYHLNIFLQHMHPFLQAQQLDYGIFVIEQNENNDFNRGKLFNIGYLEASKEPDFCCFIFHDVDLLPESPKHIYGCSEEPRHMCSALDTFRYVLPYPELFGGVVAFTKEQFSTVNGYSNLYYGWGGEDDDLYDRLTSKQLSIQRWAPEISRYTMLAHKKANPNPNRYNLLKNGHKRIEIDGLNSLHYKIMNIQLRPLYTWILVDINPL